MIRIIVVSMSTKSMVVDPLQCLSRQHQQVHITFADNHSSVQIQLSNNVFDLKLAAATTFPHDLYDTSPRLPGTSQPQISQAKSLESSGYGHLRKETWTYLCL